MRLLVINPNSTASMTDKIAVAVRLAVPARAEVLAVTNRAGPPSIKGPDDGVVASPGVLAPVAAADSDVIVMPASTTLR